jgi:hypothetical protein
MTPPEPTITDRTDLTGTIATRDADRSERFTAGQIHQFGLVCVMSRTRYIHPWSVIEWIELDEA